MTNYTRIVLRVTAGNQTAAIKKLNEVGLLDTLEGISQVAIKPVTATSKVTQKKNGYRVAKKLKTEATLKSKLSPLEGESETMTIVRSLIARPLGAKPKTILNHTTLGGIQSVYAVISQLRKNGTNIVLSENGRYKIVA